MICRKNHQRYYQLSSLLLFNKQSFTLYRWLLISKIKKQLLAQAEGY